MVLVMETGYDLIQEQRQWVSPSLIEANYILSLSRLELDQVIAEEVAENPALDLDDREICPTCGTPILGASCPNCPPAAAMERTPERSDDSHAEHLATAQVLREETEEFDPFSLVASDENILTTILRDARTLLDPRDYTVAEYLVDAIDDRGFLNCKLNETAKRLDVPLETIEMVLDVIQSVAPVGVGARDLRECLLLQLQDLALTGHEPPPTVFSIVDSHLDDLGLHKFGKIAKDLGLSTQEVVDAREFIRMHLSPTPLQTQQAKSWRSPSRAAYVAPDVIISIRNDQLQVEVVDGGRSRLHVNPMYARLAQEVGRKRAAPGTNHVDQSASPLIDGASEGDRQHIRHYATRAKNFMSNVQQRQETLLRISECVCELQETFLRDGVRELRPLTRAVVAQQVGVHESTVSRATAEKYVMLPSRKVIPFSDFFTPSLSVKDVMRELIHEEQANGRSLTDREICDLLYARGIRIARRTVAKYRNELGILPSTMR
jgi:RNA polymerase sigma-54 factor